MRKYTLKIMLLFVLSFLCVSFMNTDRVLANAPSVKYSVYVEGKGWTEYVSDGKLGGTTGQALQAEAIKIKINGSSGMIQYRTHQEDIGWHSWVSDDTVSGVTGIGLEMEAIQIRLKGELSNSYDVYYRVHVGDVGWLGWTKNGEMAGSTGCLLKIEAIEIKLCLKGNSIETSQSYIEKPVLKTSAYVKKYRMANSCYRRRNSRNYRSGKKNRKN